MLICHTTLPYGPHPEIGESVCRGYWDAYGDASTVARLMDDVFGPDNWYREVDPPEDHL